MNSPVYKIRPEMAADSNAVEALIQQVFGPGATTRAASELREGVKHMPSLAHVAVMGNTIAGSVRFTPVLWGEREVLMLGPLGVARHQAKQGIGRALMRASMETARKANEQGGHAVVILVGDLDYYQSFGFERISPDRIRLPRPADPLRVLGCGLEPDVLACCSGDVVRCHVTPDP
ncbi:MAG: GNAT family N-acetyltransferase [Rhizobiaceae bacterium]